MTYLFVKHRQDSKYEIRFTSDNDRYYRRMLLGLRAFVPLDARGYDSAARTWVVEGRCGKEVERWVARVVEDLSPAVEFICERQDAWEAAAKESYRSLHLQPSAPWEVVHAAYLSLIELWRTTDGDPGRLERINAAYERLRQEFEKDE